MSQVLSNFVRALRAQDVRVSISESVDAGRVADLVGFGDRQILKDALSQVLAKTDDEKEAFDDCFDRFFAFDQFRSKSPANDTQESEERDAQEGDNSETDEADSEEGDGGEEGGSQSQSGEAGGMPGSGGSGSEGEPSGEGAPELSPERDLTALLESGDDIELQGQLAAAGREVGADRIRLFTQRGLFTRRIMEAMGLDGLNDTIDREQRSGSPAGEARAERLRELREAFRLEVRDYVERQLELYTANAGRQLREEVLSKINISNVDRRDFKLMQALVRKMAKRLVALNSRRKKKARRGQLDVRRTIRQNIEFDGLMFDIAWKRTKVDRPKVVAICDVSGSVAQYATFLLMFLYSLTEVLPKVRAFAFSNQLGEVTDLFAEKKIEAAISDTLMLHGAGSTDYGRAFEDFEALALDDVDHRTTVLILGDGRSNFGDPRADILDKIHDRARRVLWLNPEGKSLWNTGDSEMRKLSPHCDRAVHCASLNDLERIVSEILRTAV
ncbi:MAG: VWA domain-containing protein [Parvibaculaceae bacterium]